MNLEIKFHRNNGVDKINLSVLDLQLDCQLMDCKNCVVLSRRDFECDLNSGNSFGVDNTKYNGNSILKVCF